MRFENNTKQPRKDFAQIIRSLGLESKLSDGAIQWAPNNDYTDLIYIEFKTNLTAPQRNALLSQFPNLEEV